MVITAIDVSIDFEENISKSDIDAKSRKIDFKFDYCIR